MDAANVDLKGFTEEFYERQCIGSLAPVLETLVYLKRETSVWLEVTTLLIPGENDSEAELERASDWFAGNLGLDVPWHFTAFHPDYKLLDRPPTPPTTLQRARRIARSKGIRFVYTGNVHDREGGSTWCPQCGECLIERDWFSLGRWHLRDGACASCGFPVAGVFAAQPERHGAGRVPVRLGSD
jgi:pyruvate formate lyase activating enzyme